MVVLFHLNYEQMWLPATAMPDPWRDKTTVVKYHALGVSR